MPMGIVLISDMRRPILIIGKALAEILDYVSGERQLEQRHPSLIPERGCVGEV